MFSRHEYTCPDVIYLRNRNKKIQLANLAFGAFTIAAFTVMGYVEDKKTRPEAVDLPTAP